MSDQIRTSGELDALPVGSVVRCDDAEGIGLNVCERHREGWQYVGSALHFSSAQVASDELEFTVLYRPDAPARTEPTEEQIVEAISGPWFNSRIYDPRVIAMNVAALYASQPTVAEVRAQAAQQTLDSYRITDAVRDVAYERATHAERGWTPEHDAEHGVNHLERLAIERLGFVPQDRGELVKAASLLIAAIELIDRQEVDHG